MTLQAEYIKMNSFTFGMDFSGELSEIMVLVLYSI